MSVARLEDAPAVGALSLSCQAVSDVFVFAVVVRLRACLFVVLICGLCQCTPLQVPAVAGQELTMYAVEQQYSSMHHSVNAAC